MRIRSYKRFQLVLFVLVLAFAISLWGLHQHYTYLHSTAFENANQSEVTTITSFPLQYYYVSLFFICCISIICYLYIKKSCQKEDATIKKMIKSIDTDTDLPSYLEGDLEILKNRITDLKKQHIAHTKADEKKAQEMTNFIENMVHQIKTPLTAISINEELLSMQYHDKKTQQNQQQIKRIEEIINRLLTLARLENDVMPFTFQKESLQCIIEDVIDALYPLTEGVIFDIHDLDFTCICDARWLSEAFENIIKNAIEAKSSCIQIYGEQHSGYQTIIIHDNGKGIPLPNPQVLFTRYYTNRNKNGSGIGLPLANAIVKHHFGYISIENDGGAKFTIVLPSYPLKVTSL